jgi:protein-L-isoaspartate(D-aspartate) O-methyltransferase
MGTKTKNMEIPRRRMVEEQLIARGIKDPLVLRAMSEVPRERFVPFQYSKHAYEDSPLPIEEKQTISQPYIVALMAEMLQLSLSDRVLEIGTGSGYAAAIMSRIAAEVYTVERHEKLARSARERFEQLGYENIHVHIANGTLGWPEDAPYEAIVFAAGAPKIPQPLLMQLTIGGRLVGPVGAQRNVQKLIRVRRISEDDYRMENFQGHSGEVMFVPLVGEGAWQDFSNDT